MSRQAHVPTISLSLSFPLSLRKEGLQHRILLLLPLLKVSACLAGLLSSYPLSLSLSQCLETVLSLFFALLSPLLCLLVTQKEVEEEEGTAPKKKPGENLLLHLHHYLAEQEQDVVNSQIESFQFYYSKVQLVCPRMRRQSA